MKFLSMRSVAISNDIVKSDFLNHLFTLPADENPLHWLYQHRQSLEKILCMFYRHDQFSDGQEDNIKKEIEKLILLLEIITPTHTLYSSDKLARAKRKLYKEGAQNRPESATPLQSKKEQMQTTIFNCRRVVTRFIHGFTDIFAAIASARNIHDFLGQEVMNKTLYALAGIFAAAKVSMVVSGSCLYVLGQQMSDAEKDASSWKMRFNDQVKQHMFPVARDLVWAIVRFLCISTAMNRYREYCTLGLFGFAAILKVMESYQNSSFYEQLRTTANIVEKNRPLPALDPDEKVRMLTARMAMAENSSINDSTIDIPKNNSADMFLFLLKALTASKQEVMRQDMLQVMIWFSYTAGAALCMSNLNIVKAVGGGWILLTCVFQVAWEMKKTDITKLTPRGGFFTVNVNDDSDADSVSNRRFDA